MLDVFCVFSSSFFFLLLFLPSFVFHFSLRKKGLNCVNNFYYRRANLERVLFFCFVCPKGKNKLTFEFLLKKFSVDGQTLRLVLFLFGLPKRKKVGKTFTFYKLTYFLFWNVMSDSFSFCFFPILKGKRVIK